ncbi:hypothetical protein HanIR_Chr17g0887351 [Helianthus annuus]|nr:hypothetical protein HanIR_Chr17g0887351 [Helianthus annuus]
MATGSGMSEPEILTSDRESDSGMMTDDNDDFQPFALPNLGDDTPTTDGIPDEDPFAISIPVHDHLIVDRPNDEHDVAPILAPIPLVAIPLEDLPFDDLIDVDVDLLVDGPFDDAHGAERLDEDTVTIPVFEIPGFEISPDTSLHPVSDSFESVTSSALQAVGLRRHATGSDDDIAMSATLSPLHELRPGLKPDLVPDDQRVGAPADPKPLPDRDPIPFGIPDIAPLIPDLAPTTIDPPVVEPLVPPPAPAPADVAPFHSMESDLRRVDLPTDSVQGIPTPRLRKDTPGHQTSHVLHVSVAYPHIPQSTPFTPFTSSPTDEPLRGSPPYFMSTSGPYHPLHFVGYTQDELLYSLQFRLKVMSHRVSGLESIPRPLPCPCQHASVPPSSSLPPFARPPPPLTPFPEFDTRFLTVEQQVRYLLHHVHKLEEELAHVLSLIFLPPPPPPLVQ